MDTHAGWQPTARWSKRSNLAGYRAGFVTGDPDLIAQLLEIRRHAGMMVPTPIQAAMTATDERTAPPPPGWRALPRARRVARPALRPGWNLSRSRPASRSGPLGAVVWLVSLSTRVKT